MVRISIDANAYYAYKSYMGSKEILKRLKQEGFVQVSQKGSHVKMRHSDGRIVIVPTPKKDLPLGTIQSIEKQAKILF